MNVSLLQKALRSPATDKSLEQLMKMNSTHISWTGSGHVGGWPIRGRGLHWNFSWCSCVPFCRCLLAILGGCTCQANNHAHHSKCCSDPKDAEEKFAPVANEACVHSILLPFLIELFKERLLQI